MCKTKQTKKKLLRNNKNNVNMNMKLTQFSNG